MNHRPSSEKTKLGFFLGKKQIKAFVLLIVTIVCLYLAANYTPPGRTLISLVYFFKTALASEKSFSISTYKQPQFLNITYDDGNTKTEAWLFKPNQSQSHSAIIISPGVGIRQDNKILIMKMADNLRKSGITVLVPFPQDLKNDLITADSVESYKNAFLYIKSLQGINTNKIGFFGFCVGSDIALLASAKPQISDQVSFVLAFASYANLADYYSEALSKKSIGKIERGWTANPLTYQILLKNLFVRLDNANDTKILSDYFINNENNSGQLNNLTKEGKQILGYIASNDPVYIRTNFPDTSPLIKKSLDEFSPVNYANQIKAPVYIIHDRNDNFEPIEESERLKSAFADRAIFLETTILDHTVLRDNLPMSIWLGQGAQLINFFYQVFQKTS